MNFLEQEANEKGHTGEFASYPTALRRLLSTLQYNILYRTEVQKSGKTVIATYRTAITVSSIWRAITKLILVFAGAGQAAPSGDTLMQTIQSHNCLPSSAE